ncbi:MAG: hypothetical protein DMD81_17510 [Candidatus Rokuibacteriota bacterium]|nr:MAG: hypothetical protein DMD81_17510 [Candidatus Rokubacteria bacterium]
MCRHGRKPGYLFLAFMIAVQVVALVRSANAKSTLVVAQDGLGSPTDCDAATPTPYTTIAAAVTAAGPHDVIKICPGVYDEQIVVTKPLTLRGENGAVVKPSPMVANTTSLTTGNPLAVVILVDGVRDVTIERLTIDGADNGLACTPSLFGLFYRNASGVARDNVITNMRPGLAVCPLSGTGVLVQSAAGGVSKVTLEGNSIHDYQKNGVTANEVGTDVRIGKRNIVTGLGSTSGSVQNGIQLAFGATGVVEDNVVTNNLFAGCVSVDVCSVNATNVLIAASTGVRVSDNVLGHSQTGVSVGGDGNAIKHNVIFDTKVFDGVALFGNHNEVRDNDITRSDESGVFVDGDQNKIEGNRINEAPVGILKSGSGNVIAGNQFFNTPTPDPPAQSLGSRASPQR